MIHAVYPEYKDSGVEWLGQVPTHWVVAPFKWQLDSNDGGAWGDEPTGENDTFVLRSTDQSVDGCWKIDDPAPRVLSERDKRSTLLKKGDLVVTKSSGSSLHIGKTTLVSEEVEAMSCCFGNFMQRLRTKASLLPRLAWYIMNNRIARLQLDLLSNSTTGLANLNGTIIGEIILSIPPVDEQATIVFFLDHETARIDALIAEQQRLIALLKEKRQAVISHAVTKGLDPGAPMKDSGVEMKDSGVEWLGEVPAHWDVVALRRVLQRIEQGWSPECFNFPADEESWGVLKAGAVNNGIYRESDNKALPEEVEPRPNIEVVPGDLLMCRASGSADLIGSAAYVESTRSRLMLSDKLFRLVVSQEACPEFVALSLGSIPLRRQIELSINGAEGLANNLSQASIKALKITLPPVLEQRRIISQIAAALNELKEQLDLAVDTVSLLQERRSALISAAVTGKIDVRGWQAPVGPTTCAESGYRENV